MDGLEALDVPKLGVHGNHDPPGRLAEFGVADVQLSVAALGGLTVTGFEGCPRYRRDGGPFQLTDDEAEARAARLPAADVLLTHTPPLGVNDEPDDPAHTGFAALSAWVERHEPAYLLHGHTHPRVGAAATTSIGATRVVHVHGARVLDLL